MWCMVEHQAVEDSIGNILKLCQLFWFSKEKLRKALGNQNLKLTPRICCNFNTQKFCSQKSFCRISVKIAMLLRNYLLLNDLIVSSFYHFEIREGCFYIIMIKGTSNWWFWGRKNCAIFRGQNIRNCPLLWESSHWGSPYPFATDIICEWSLSVASVQIDVNLGPSHITLSPDQSHLTEAANFAYT